MKFFIKATFLFLVLFIPTLLFAEYDLNDNCKKAYKQIMTMRFDDAAVTITGEMKSNPDNLYIPFLQYYSDMVKLIITDDPQLYAKIKEDYWDYIEIMEKDEASPYFEILKSEMLFHLSLANMKYGDKFTGVRNLIKSNKLCKSNVEEFPGFWLNNKMSGTFNVIFSFIPSSFQWAARIIGLKGNHDAGIKQLNQYHEDATGIPGMAEESVLYFGLARKYGGDDMAAYEYIKNVNPHYYENPLVKYFYAVLCVRSFNNEVGLELVQSLNTGTFQVMFYPYDYLIGKAKLNRLDDDADVYLKRFYNNSPGEEYKKEICYKIAQYYLINNDKTQFEIWKNRIEDVGNDMTDRDREAEIESDQDYQPLPEMVKVQLLFEGGYFERAQLQLNDIPVSKISASPYDIEFIYWTGRLYQQTERLQEAIAIFEDIINNGEAVEYYFAADAAYQIGKIHEDSKHYSSAKRYYELCLEINDSDWEYFIKIKSERGVTRVDRLL